MGKQKYVAVINNYGDSEESIAKLETMGALNIRTLFNLEKGYIKDRYESNKRIRYLENIWKAEKESELNNLKEPLTVVDEIKPQEHSLEASLRNADLDVLRLVDEHSGLAAPLLSQFMPATKLKGREDWIPESDHYKYYDESNNFAIDIEKEYDIHFPENLNIYCYEQSNISSFPHPKKGLTNVYNYYLLDGGSVLPALALDVKPGNKVLDMCAAPGGKSFIILQTLYPDYLVCNDTSFSRVNRIYDVLNQYFYDLEDRWIKTKRLKVTQLDGMNYNEDNFDRILVILILKCFN